MKKKIRLCGRELSYELERKNVKNINLRVKADGSIYVSANRRVSESVIESFILSKAEFILRAVDNAAAPAPVHSFKDGDSIYLYGLPFRLELNEGVKAVRADIERQRITVSGIEAPESVRRALELFFRRICEEDVTRCCQMVYPLYKKLGIPFPELRFRKMRSRWGSCQPETAVLTFNTALVHVPPECMEYVVCHEFTHFLHPDHSKAFYESLAKVVPEWKERRKQLKKYNFVIE